MRDEVTITLRKDELRGIIVALTEHFDRTSGTFEEIAARYPILANGYDRLCEQAWSANVSTLCDKSVNGGAA